MLLFSRSSEADSSMTSLKQYLIENFEAVFILIILAVVSMIVWFVDSKLSFLNFFYLPVLLSSYYLGIRSGVLGAFFTFLVVAIFTTLFPERFVGPSDLVDIWASIVIWAGFLILTAAIVGFTHRELQEKITEALRAKAEASGNAALLEQTISTIREFESELDYKVEERTRTLQEKADSITAHKKQVEEALFATMDPAVVKLMTEGRIRSENRRISVMFSSLKDFAEYAEQNSAELVINKLNRYLADMETTLLQFNAHIDKYMGDSIMSEFGAPIRFEKHALLALGCAWKMQESMRMGPHPLQLRIGVATGVATTGIIGAKRQSFTAFGDTVNLAARIEAACEPGSVTVDEATYRDCKDFFDFRPVADQASVTQSDKPGLIAEIASPQLYEVVAFKNPLQHCQQLPQHLLKDLEVRLDNLLVYPEDHILPVECIDGSVGFSRLIGATAYLLADSMKLGDQEKHDVLEAGYLAEVGKSIVPENILNRNGGLTEGDFAHIHMHPREGIRKLRNNGYENERMLELIECHHENFDGSGYPAGIKGEAIPIGARILAVAEAYISLTSKRPYRNPWDSKAALNEIRKQAASGKFDASVVNALSKLIQ